MMLGFYILLRCMGVSAWLSALGGIIWLFFLFLYTDIGRTYLEVYHFGIHSANNCRNRTYIQKEISIGRSTFTALFLALQVLFQTMCR